MAMEKLAILFCILSVTLANHIHCICPCVEVEPHPTCPPCELTTANTTPKTEQEEVTVATTTPKPQPETKPTQAPSQVESKPTQAPCQVESKPTQAPCQVESKPTQAPSQVATTLKPMTTGNAAPGGCTIEIRGPQVFGNCGCTAAMSGTPNACQATQIGSCKSGNTIKDGHYDCTQFNQIYREFVFWNTRLSAGRCVDIVTQAPPAATTPNSAGALTLVFSMATVMFALLN